MDLCAGCLLDLPWVASACLRCGAALPSGHQYCGPCQSGPVVVDRCIAALNYEYPVDRLIAALKFQRRLYIARVLGDLLAVRLAEAFHDDQLVKPDIVLPVPLHPSRESGRTFNQAAEIAAGIAAGYGLAMRPNLCQRIRPTPAQSGLSRASRLRNLQGAFRMTARVDHQRIAIVDDVITTGATTTQLARLCKSHGAKEVQVWAVARTSI